MSSPVKSFGGHMPGSTTRRPAKLRIANPDSSDEESSKASTAHREELFQRARLSQETPAPFHVSTASAGAGPSSNGGGAGGPWSAHPGASRPMLNGITAPAGPERSQSSPTLPGARALPSPVAGPADANGAGQRQPGYFAPQRSASVLTNAGSTAATTPLATPGFSGVAPLASAAPPPPPPPPPNLTGRDLDAWKSIAQAQTYTSPTSLFSAGGSSPPLRPLPRPAPPAQSAAASVAPSNASSSPSTSSLPPISPGSPLSLSLGFSSGPSLPAPEPPVQPRGKTPPPKSATWRNAPRPPSPLRTTAPAAPFGHSSSPLGLAVAGQISRPIEHPPIGRVTLLATTDGHKFASADVSGSTCSAMIREKIFTALEIPDDEQPAFLLRRHAMGGGSSQMESALEGDSLYLYCAESGEPIKGVLAVMSFEQSHPSMPIMPPPIPSGPSSSTSKRSDDDSNASGRYPRPPTSQSETASSVSELNALDEANDGRPGQIKSNGGAAYPTSASETSISATDVDHPSGGSSGGTSSLRRKPHQRRSSHLFSGPRRTTSPSSASSRRRDSPASSVTSPTSPPIPLQSSEALGVDENLFGRRGSVTPTWPAEPPTQFESQRLVPPPLPYRRPPSMSPEEIRQMGSSESIDEQERILRTIHEARERDRRMVEEMIERERAEEMAREWERRDREEEDARRRRQIQEDEETAMEEQRKEQELYKARLEQQLEQQLERERSQRAMAQQQAPGSVNEFGDWGFGAGRPPQSLTNRSVPAGGAAAAHANSLSGYQDPYRPAQTIGHRGSEPSAHEHGAATMFPSSRFATQSAVASQLMNQRPPLPSGPLSRTRGPDYDRHPMGGGTLPRGGGPSYPQSVYAQAPHPSMFPSAGSASELANRRQQQGSLTPQPQRLAHDGRPANLGSAQAAHAHNLQQMRSNPNFRGGMPLPGQNRPRPQQQQQQQPTSGGSRPQDGPYLSGTLAVGGRRVASPPGNLSPPVQQGGFGHSQTYPSGSQANSGYSRNASPNRSPLPLGPNSPRSPVLGETRIASPRPSTMFDAGQPGSSSTLPRRPSSHHDPPSSAVEHGTTSQDLAATAHGRFATEGASPHLPTVDLAPPPPYMPSPELRPSSPVPVPSLSQPPSPDAAARESAYGGLFDYMVNDSGDAPGSVSPNSTATGESTEIGYRLAARASSATGPVLPEGGDNSDDDDDSDDDTGTNALFLPQRPVAKSAPTSAHPAHWDDGEDSTFTSDMRQLILDTGDDTFRSDESTLGPLGRLSNRSLPPIDTSGTASAPISAIHTTPQEMAQASLPLSSASPERVTPDSGDPVGDEQLSTASHLRRKKTVFEKNEDKQWAFRPPAEQVVRELSKFFPEINLEAEFIEADGSHPGEGSSTAAAASAAAATAAAESATRETKLRNRKSIRRVAEERQRSDLPSASTLLSTTQLRPPVDVKVVRRRSTRMWGGRVEEVKPGAFKGQLGAVTPEASLEAATTFKWVKGDLIGKGAYGRVYLGLNATTGEMLAVKQVEVPSTMSDRVDDRQSQVIAALRSEIQLLKDLDHPNVVQYLGFEESPDFISIFLEYVPGGSLGSVFRKYGKLEEAEVRWFTRQILDGLAYLHGRGILHRDLKGDNILVDPNHHGVVKITDFGVSKQTLEEATQMGGTLMTGSLYWMAPEVVTNAGQGYNSKIDLWSLGCVVLEMLSGARPWQGLEMMPIILKLGHGERPPMPADLVLSPEAADFVYEQSFAVNPAERFSATEALGHPFVQLDPAWDWTRNSALARKVSSTRPRGGSGRGRRKKD